MQCNLLYCLFESSNLFFLGVVVKLFDDFWKPNCLYSKFFVNCLLIFYFVYCITGALKLLVEPVNAHSRWWPCACLKFVFGLRRLEKNLSFLRCIHIIDPVLKYGSDINEGNWLQLLFCLIVLIGMVASVIGISLFSYVSCCGSKFSRIALLRKRLQLDSKMIWPRMDWFWGFLLEKGFFRQFHICIDRNLQELLSCYSFWRHQVFLIFSLMDILVCSLKKLVLFSHRIL